MAAKNIKVVLADDHALLRTGLKMLLESRPELTVIGTASNGYDTLKILEQTAADILVLDLSMPGMDGMECIREIKSRGIKVRVIVLTMHEDENYMKEVMKAGALAYVPKSSVDTEIFAAIEAVVQGKIYLNPDNTQLLLGSLFNPERPPVEDDPYQILSSREREVLKLLAYGHSITEISVKLALSVKTIETYKARLMEKLRFTRRSELVSYALKHRLLC
ncbi:response regulator transcription factor [Sporomusa sp.]|uniref:response regulator transcription factor n=1 Tax=Sporomusa sp. TaxID=2078658 RepID=UPI002B60F6CE|nr:response regulator transcription factor [Sporomusa sp.]HWR43555.1 response regulator transcription factor [Sporomusa sp.]